MLREALLPILFLALVSSSFAESDESNDVDTEVIKKTEQSSSTIIPKTISQPVENNGSDGNPNSTSYLSSPVVQTIIKLNVPALTRIIVFYAAVPDCSLPRSKKLEALYDRAKADPDKCLLHTIKELVVNLNTTILDGMKIYKSVESFIKGDNNLMILSKMMLENQKAFRDMVAHVENVLNDTLTLKKSPQCVNDEVKDLRKLFQKEYDEIVKCVDQEIDDAVKKGKKGFHL